MDSGIQKALKQNTDVSPHKVTEMWDANFFLRYRMEF